MASSSHTTTDHAEIKRWVEAHGGCPATVKGTERGGEDAGILRINFPGVGAEESLENIPWDEFFEKFEDAKLAFVYQDKKADGKESRFAKLVSR